MCDRIGIVNRGKLVAIGTIDELRSIAAAEGENLEELFLKLTGGALTANLPGFESE
jgi:ABC-2 type transport system ATP-binding protein